MLPSIPLKVKKECCRMWREGMKPKDIYRNYYTKQVENPCSLKAFRSLLSKWRKQTFPDDATLECGTYEGFVAHGATVQVSKTGEIVQAWIKQNANGFDVDEYLAGVLDKIERYEYKPQNDSSSDRMLEIPLFDMHWGVMYLEYYKIVLDDVLELICSKH